MMKIRKREQSPQNNFSSSPPQESPRRDFDAREVVCRGQHKVPGFRPWVGFRGPEDLSMKAMWEDTRPEKALAMALYQNFHDCYMDLIVQHP